MLSQGRSEPRLTSESVKRRKYVRCNGKDPKVDTAGAEDGGCEMARDGGKPSNENDLQGARQC